MQFIGILNNQNRASEFCDSFTQSQVLKDV